MPIPQLRTKRSDPWRNRQYSRSAVHSPVKKPKKLAKKLFVGAFFVAAVLVITLAIYTVIISRNLPNPNQLINRDIAQSTKIYDRATGTVTYGRIPSGSVVVSGNLPSADGKYSLYCAVIVKRVDAQTRAKTSLNDLLRD